MDLKISDYLTDGNWHSFVEKAIIECPMEHYENLLNKYLDMGKTYNINFSYANIEPAIALLGSNYTPYDRSGGQLLITSINPSHDYRWQNGLKFMDIISKRMPNLITD